MRVALALTLAFLAAGAGIDAQSRNRGAAPPSGTKVVSGRHFDVFVTKGEDKPITNGYVSHVFNVLIVAHTKTHGTQQIRRRVETINGNLLDASNWEIVDFDKDGWDDYRYVASISDKGCRTWDAQRWEPDHDRFTSAPKSAKWTDARGQAVQGSCIGK